MTIRGTVGSRREAVLRLRVFGPTGAAAEVDALVDTGYTGTLILPDTVIAALELHARAGGRVTLADGSERDHRNYTAAVEWDGKPRRVIVSAVGDEPLIGMKLLAGYELRVEVTPGGAVEVRPLPAPPPSTPAGPAA